MSRDPLLSSSTPLPLDIANEALKKLQDSTEDSRTPSRSLDSVSSDEIQRNDFLYLCEQNGAVYDAVRSLISDETYWQKEEAHFGLVMILIRRWNLSKAQRGPFRLQCPAVDTIAALYKDHMEQAGQEHENQPREPVDTSELLPGARSDVSSSSRPQSIVASLEDGTDHSIREVNQDNDHEVPKSEQTCDERNLIARSPSDEELWQESREQRHDSAQHSDILRQSNPPRKNALEICRAAGMTGIDLLRSIPSGVMKFIRGQR